MFVTRADAAGIQIDQPIYVYTYADHNKKNNNNGLMQPAHNEEMKTAMMRCRYCFLSVHAECDENDGNGAPD